MDISIGNRSQATGRFNFVRDAQGEVQFDDTEAHAVMTSVAEELQSWWADPTHGSLLYTLKNLTARAPSQAEAFTVAALQAIENDGSIESVIATAKSGTSDSGLGVLQLDVRWTKPGGSAQKQTVEV